VIDCALAAEQAGWDGYFLWDHLLFDEGAPFIDPWVAMSAIAVRTEHLTLGPMVTPLPRRRPWKVAREAATLDHLSGGRLILGVGLGTDYWREYSAFGEPAETERERGRMLDEGIAVIDALWSGEAVDFIGEHYHLDHAQLLPRPLQRPRVPIWSAALLPIRPAPLRRAAGCDGIMPVKMGGAISPAEVSDLVDSISALRGGADPFDVCVVASAPINVWEQAGATWLLTSLRPDVSNADALALISRGPERT
jgi:alkanesulfonate monooxygenase SsuD/methylene tetrahydromethanopterin reductase-like flavin-dependent oxidoreductase (luciferase family)